MPTNRAFKSRAPGFVYDESVRAHLLYGDCLLAGKGRGCGCGLNDENGILREDIARSMWLAHREEVLAYLATNPHLKRYCDGGIAWGVRFD